MVKRATTPRLRLTLPVLLLTVACAESSPPADPSALQPSGSALLFDDVRLFDGEKLIPRADVLVRGDRIAEIAARIEPPPGAEIVPGAGHTLMPGLIDSHVHIWGENQLAQAPIFGVTTMLDMLTDAKLAVSLEEKLRSPAGATWADLRSAGNAVTAPGGHGTEYGIPIRTIGGAGEAEAFVAACAAEGSDYIKIIYAPRSKRFPSIDRETMAAVIAAAHRRKLIAVAHIEMLDDAREAIEAGVDGLAHLFLRPRADDGFAELAARRGAFIIPTLSVLASISGRSGGPALVGDPSMAPFLTSFDMDSLRRSFGRLIPGLDLDVALETIKLLRARRVPILAGSDAPNPGTTYGATVHGELALLVEAGLTPVEALASATSAPARAFRLDRGRVAAGLRADLLLMAGDPTRDIRATRSIAGVWKLGRRIDRDAYRAAVTAERDRARLVK